ncbi:MAG: 4Fe-4S binding protein, partial [Candidatus Helarchaeota archaeon]|nr:4Fe-4S binding protein [Candidatus Helarchaeota archaeon]
IIEFYILRRDDTEENLQKIAKLFSDMIDKIFPQWLITMKTSLLRPKLPVEAEEKLINIDKIIESGSQVLPHELVVEMINKNDYFAKLPCVCRSIGEYSDNPCKVASPELGCLAAGMVAKFLVQEGMGTELTKDEAIDYLKRAEKAGLVHNGANSSGPVTYMLICNCCTCHCGFLRPQAKFGAPGTKRSNFSPKINNDLCNKCETCVKKCPMSALFHHYPFEPDESDDYILFKENTCIGCGVCAANCPNNAIMMEKIRDDAVPEQLKLGDKSALEVLFG